MSRIFCKRARRGQSGLTIVEMMVALLIASILLAGLVTIFASMRRSFATTRALNDLSNEQRFASTELSNAIDTAGYYPLTNRAVRGQYPDAQAAFPVSATTIGGQAIDFATAGQVVYGTGATSSGSTDVVAVRMIYGATPSSPFDCLGQAPAGGTSSAATRVTSVFWVDTARNELKCATSSNTGGASLVGGQALPANNAEAFGGVKSLQVEYGVDTSRDGSVDRFMSAAKLNSTAGRICPDVISGAGNSSSCWPYVRSVQFTLAFVSSLNQAKSTLPLTHTVKLSNTDGKTLNSNLD